MKFKNKKELVEFIKTQLNIELENDTTNVLNKKRNTLYTEIPYKHRTPIMSLLYKYDIRVEQHRFDNYWIFVK